jgi:hypothetical protein
VRLRLVLTTFLLAARALGAEPTLVALTQAGRLVLFPADRPAEGRTVAVGGVAGVLVGIDVRPADRRLYGLGGASELTGSTRRPAAPAPRLAHRAVRRRGALRGRFQSAGRPLRLVSADRQNLRVHPTLGAAAVDRPLA